ncbi:uncharacterized protein LOC111704216 [Eurytemora carolleeae]|uniref:uncharacterized protein LOC111704216 n=1 Tax=Eurytemora carolleeae TaxID=1294199 RepID=UPI000C78FD48|nr:uncharacterized protein LOC111704216 [Eurytemora carolleeae]|eukprot:XP_023332136.1 uncharacterized protein LOC111704216 [Eurytemora affinis]
MATATPTTAPVPAFKEEKYERIILEANPQQEQEIEQAKELLDTILCCFLDVDDEKYEEEEAKEGEEEEGESPYEKDVEKQREMSSKVLPKGFPFNACLSMKSSEEELTTALDSPIFNSYNGAVYWNECGRDFIVDPNQPKENFQPENMANLVYHSLKPIMIHPGGDKKLTIKGMCEEIGKLNFNAGEHVFLENIEIQLREIDDKEVMVIIFYTGA